MKFVVHLADFGWPVDADELAGFLGDVGELTEAGGLDGIAVGDHLWQHPIMGGPEGACVEAYTTLGFLAAHTTSIRLMTLATGAHFRYPGVLAKTVTTLDVLSGGRAWLGIGSGHYQEECEGLGVPFPPLADRYELLEDALEMRACGQANTGMTVRSTGIMCTRSGCSTCPRRWNGRIRRS
jgi:alkanesulfonate monooxygenase SsuD/methylene tetrahydromethanopterin reductase-like flavin-dependent oxidoreductase (luciferase family)